MISFILLTSILPTKGFSKELEGVPSSLQTPQDLANWLSREFVYRIEFPDRWQMPQETINSKKGDCEDFAILVSSLLTQSGTPNDIIIVKFRELNISHAVCIWQDKDGTYNFISNRKLTHTGRKSIEEAIGKFYPDWEKIIFSDGKKQHRKILVRR
ncbi:MAG: transglutaminase-like domain-containing protein [Candidatus Omnitrophota bacterium]